VVVGHRHGDVIDLAGQRKVGAVFQRADPLPLDDLALVDDAVLVLVGPVLHLPAGELRPEALVVRGVLDLLGAGEAPVLVELQVSVLPEVRGVGRVRRAPRELGVHAFLEHRRVEAAVHLLEERLRGGRLDGVDRLGLDRVGRAHELLRVAEHRGVSVPLAAVSVLGRGAGAVLVHDREELHVAASFAAVDVELQVLGRALGDDAQLVVAAVLVREALVRVPGRDVVGTVDVDGQRALDVDGVVLAAAGQGGQEGQAQGDEGVAHDRASVVGVTVGELHDSLLRISVSFSHLLPISEDNPCYLLG